MADALPISVAKVEADRALSYINSFGASWFGKTPADLIGRDILEINPNLRRQDFSTAVSAALSGQLNRNEQYLKFPGGVERWCEFFRIPETTSAGDPDGYYVLMIDASARKQAEADRTRILEQYRFVADNLPVFLVHLDKEMRIDLVNRTGAQWCARAPHEVVGRLLSDVFDDSVSSNDLLARLTKDDRANSATQEHEIFLRFPDGTSRQCMAIHAPDNAGDGHLRGRLLLLIDITARKQAYSKLEASEARFSAFMDALPAAAWVKDTDGHLTFMNQTLKAALAASDPGHDVPNFAVDPVWPNLRERRDATDREVLVHGRPTHTFFETRDRNTGEIRYWQTIKFPICDNERRETLVGGIAIDLTEKMRAQKLLEASEARFSAFMDALPATAVIKDATGRYVYMNRRWDDLGRGPRHEWMNRTAIEMMPPEIAGRAAELDLRVLQSGEPVEYVAEYPRPDGGIGVWRHSKFRFAGSSGQPLIGMISIDVTKEHLLEQERRESAARRRLAVAAANIGSDASGLTSGNYVDVICALQGAGAVNTWWKAPTSTTWTAGPEGTATATATSGGNIVRWGSHVNSTAVSQWAYLLSAADDRQDNAALDSTSSFPRNGRELSTRPAWLQANVSLWARSVPVLAGDEWTVGTVYDHGNLDPVTAVSPGQDWRSTDDNATVDITWTLDADANGYLGSTSLGVVLREPNFRTATLSGYDGSTYTTLVSIDIATGLGSHVTVMGLSLGGLMSTWAEIGRAHV